MVDAGNEAPDVVRSRTERALQSARKYSLVANSVKAEIIVDARIEVVSYTEQRLGMFSGWLTRCRASPASLS